MKKLKIISLVLLLLSITTFLFSRTITTSVYGSSTGYAISLGTTILSEGIIGGGIRTVSCPNDVKFYWGSDLFVGYPTTLIVMDSYYGGYIIGQTEDDFFMSLKIPLGYRWPGENKKGGFFLGAGPAAQMIINWGDPAVYSFGGFLELGFQTNKKENVGFHFCFQMGISPLLLALGEGWSTEIPASEASFQFGLSWRRVKE